MVGGARAVNQPASEILTIDLDLSEGIVRETGGRLVSFARFVNL